MSYLTEAKQRELQQANFTETASYLVNHYSYTTSGNRQQSQNVSKSAVDRILTEILNGSYENDADNNINTLREIKEVLGGNENIVSFLGNKAIKVPSGTNAERPDTNQQANGQLRYNTETNSFEGYINNQWGNIGGGGGGGGSSNFTGLNDTPSNFTNSANKLLSINSNANAIEFIDKTFTSLTDTPANYIGMANKILSVNANADGLEFINNSSGTTFTGLTETPTNLGSAGQILAVASNGTSLEFINNSSGGGSTTLVGLTDVPNNYTGHGGKVLKIKADATGIEFSDSAGGVAKFVDLTETPVSLGTVGQILAVAAGETNLEFVDRFVIDSSNRLNANLIHDGTISNTEFGYLNGVTSNIQTQLNSKQSTIDSSNRLNANLIHDGNVSNTEFGYLNGVTSDIQTQLTSNQLSLGLRAMKNNPKFTGNVGIGTTDPKAQLNIYKEGDTSIRVTAMPSGGNDKDASLELIEYTNSELQYGASLTYKGSNNRFVIDMYDNNTQRNAFTILRADPNNVGIGTTNPSSKLHVYKETNIETKIESPSGYVDLQLASGNNSYIGYNNDFRIYQLGANFPEAYKLSIKKDTGRVGIGTTNPASKLEVIGDISCGSITVGNITNTEFGYLNGVTSDIQTQLNSKQNTLTAGTGITIDGDTINSTVTGGGVDIDENTDISLNNLKVHGDLSGVNANFNVLSSKKLKLNNIQFNESFKSQETRIINVTAAGGKFYFDGIINPKLYLVPGITYRFNQGDGTNATHPLRFSTIDNNSNTYRYNKNVTVNGTQGQEGAYTEIQVTEENKDKFFYVCTSHSGMGNVVYVLNSRNIRDLSGMDASFNNISSSKFYGNLVGDVTGTVLTASQPNITSIGTLSSLNVAGSIAGLITTPTQSNITRVGSLTKLIVSGDLSGNDASFNDISCVNIYGKLHGEVSGDITGTIQTNSQPNITSIGTLTNLIVSGDLSGNDASFNDISSVNIYGKLHGEVSGDVTGNVTGNVTGDLTGTIQTADQPNITSLGELTKLKMNGDISTNKLYVYDNIYHNQNNFNIQLGYHNSNKGIASDKTFCIAIGNQSIVNESYGIAIGSSKSLSNFTSAFGWAGSAVGIYSMSLGNSSNIANGQYSTCLGGKQNYSNDYAEVSIGQYSTNTTNNSDSYDENNVALRIGNGISSSDRSDCMIVKFTGDLSLNKDICCNSIYLVNDVSCNSAEFKVKATAPTMETNDDSTNIATTAFVKAKVDAVIGTAGTDYDTLGEIASAVTNNTTNITSNSTTISNLNTTYATIDNPTFTGTVSGVTAAHVNLGNVTNESKTTMFSSPTFTGTVSVPILKFDGSIKIGDNTTASHSESMAIGKDANAGAYQNSSAIGHGATVDANNTIQLGNSSMEFVNTSGTVTMASDIRLKDNITTLDDSLEKIKNIRGVSFTRNDLPNKNKKYIGVIAQELENIIPEVVNDNGSYKSVMYNNLVGLLIEGIKDLSDKNDKLEKELSEVKKHLGL